MWGRLSLGSTDQRWVAQPRRGEQTRNTQSRVPDQHQEGPRTPSSIRDHVSNHQKSRAGLRAETGGMSCWSRQDNSTARSRKHRAQTFPRVTCGRLMTQEWAETLGYLQGVTPLQAILPSTPLCCLTAGAVTEHCVHLSFHGSAPRSY